MKDFEYETKATKATREKAREALIYLAASVAVVLVVVAWNFGPRWYNAWTAPEQVSAPTRPSASTTIPQQQRSRTPSPEPSRSRENTRRVEDSVEVNLARIDLGTASPSDAQVRPYVQLLNRLEARCIEGRTMIGDMATRATQLIERDFGREVTARLVLEELVDATGGTSSITCSERLAPLIVLIGRGSG